MGYRDYSVAKGLMVDATGHGDFTTISAALAVAVSGQTIFIRPGTYTEDPPLVAGVNLCAFDSDAYTPTVTIVGNCSFSAAGIVSMNGIRLQTNSNFLLSVTGSSASVINLINCYLNCTNNTGISFTSSSSSSSINLYECYTDVTTIGITLFVCTGSGGMSFFYCRITNTGNSTTPSSTTSGASIQSCTIAILLTDSSPVGSRIFHCRNNNGSLNSVIYSYTGTGGAYVDHCTFFSGTASCISVSSPGDIHVSNCTIDSSNTNAITGTGRLIDGGNVLTSSVGINVTTRIPISYTIQEGGTFASAFNTNGAVYSNTTTTGALQSASLSSGQLLIGGTGAPAAATLTAGTGIGIVNGNNSITLSSIGGGLASVDITGTTQAAAVNTAYTANNSSLVTITLPSTAAYGSIIGIVGKGTGGWLIAQNSGQTIHFGAVNSTTGTGGSLASTKQYDVVFLFCSIANTDFTVIQSVANITVV